MRLIDRPLLTAWIATLFISPVGFVTGGTFSVPQGDPIATVRLPPKWKTDEHSEFVEAVAPDGATHLLLLGVEGRKVAESVGEAFRYIRGIDPMFIKPQKMKDETVTVKGRQLRRLSWDANRHDQTIIIRCHVVSMAEGKQLLVMFWGSLESEKKYQQELNNLFETLRPVEE